MAELSSWPLTRLARAVRARELSAEDVVRHFLEQARRTDPTLRCFIAIEGDRALEDARERDARAGRPGLPERLLGVPFAVKDIFAYDGRPPTAGTRRVRLRMRERNSSVIDRLVTGGAVSIGRLNLDQFGYAATGLNPEFGDTRNPWDPERIAGGSSGGAAAAVAAGALPFGLGSDTGGSGRIPASYCGVTGLKPTLGRVPKRGCLPLSYAQDTVSIIARSALDLALVLEVCAGRDPLDATTFAAPVPPFAADLERDDLRLDGLRIGVDRAVLEGGCSPEVSERVQGALSVLVELGAELRDVDLSALERYDVAATVLTWAEVAAAHSHVFAAHRDDYAPAVRARLEAAQLAHGADHVNALRYQGRALRQFLEEVMSRVDVIALPTTGRTAPSVESLDDDTAGVEGSVEALRRNRPFNFLGVPALSLPVGFDQSGLPVGLQLAGRPWSEGCLFQVAAAYQRVTDWHRRSPALNRRGVGAAAEEESR